ncbi:NADH:ubiquinone reductase (Na(+)-transporting) subunit D [Candidatus Ozemobacteraceae bacterium]|nr:NADH:ubiquinone reductase (Na(+)-transporting) subunit D [Candidatus Ozemobacteraceae bacterium]
MNTIETTGQRSGEAWKSFRTSLGEQHPIFVSVLGICSTLAVTSAVRYAVVMAGIVTVTLLLSALIVSLLRRHIPTTYRIITSLLLISTPVILLEKLLRLQAPAIAGELGPYVGLVITNCIILGRIEACASLRPPKIAMADALGASLGYGSVLIVIAAAREVLGTGRLLGYEVAPAWYPACAFFQRPAGAFLALALTLALFRYLHGSGNHPGTGAACHSQPPDKVARGNGCDA